MNTPIRFASVTGLLPEKAAYYRDLHANPWPRIIDRLKKSNIQNYSIFVHEINGQPFLFSYLEYVGSNWEDDQRKIAEDPETRRWWKETDPCQKPLPEADSTGKIWADMEEVFHMD
ncbi:MAG: L-rhamnose mutarotase [Puniceicoccales bacterium]|jgi:L-rhamnose mutarotase|nr:L-rhamnose mutarotase [Puniceicoccales bacterium]